MKESTKPLSDFLKAGEILQLDQLFIKRVEIYRPLSQVYSLFYKEKDAVLLDSSSQDKNSRFSILARKPYLRLCQKRTASKQIVFTINGEIHSGNIHDFLKEYLASHQQENPTPLPMISGAIGYFTYDYGRRREEISSRFEVEQDLIPEAVWNFYSQLYIEDCENKIIYLIANVESKLPSPAISAEIFQEMEGFLAKAEVYHGKTQEILQRNKNQSYQLSIQEDSTEEDYLDKVRSMINYIVEGDIYITNLTRQLQVFSHKDPYRVYQILRQINPAPFGGFFQYGNYQIASASPERFLKMKKGQIETCPIKGTRRRGNNPQEDALLKKELEESQKDRSELLMIVDLERNDLSKVCRPASVQVAKLFEVEEHATVFHLLATITGELEKGRDVMDLIDASFPGGSITGAPKIRSMEIIDELEEGKRGLYTGSMGYITLDNSCDLNIIIRSLVHKDGIYHLGVGGGITCESEDEFEFEETWQKAHALLEALEGTPDTNKEP